MASVQIILALATLLPVLNSEYIPPGPLYPCPKASESHLLYPCVCEKGTDAGLFIRCENTGLAVMSVGLGNIAGLGLPIERLVLKEAKIAHLFGPLLHRSSVRTLHVVDTPLKSIDQYALAGVNRTLQEIYMVNTNIAEFPKDAFRILGNLSVLSIDGHRMRALRADALAGGAAGARLERLHLANGQLADLAPDAFQYLKKLKTLDLHGNRLATLKRNQFKGLRDVEVLDLSYNNLTKLDGSHIGDLTKLGWCNASHNQIGEIPRGMFARNTVIKVVHLDHNRIRKLDTNSFRGMRFLRRLYLHDNQIAEVGRGTFAAATRVGTVDLARNLITKVDYQMFQQVRYAEIINLAENRITTIEKQAFTDLYLAVVNVSHNALSTVEAGAFVNCNNLTLLDLSHNNLTGFQRNAFDENSYASEFQLSYNQFTDLGHIPIQNMTGIRVLNVSHNALTVVPKLAFPKLYELHTVDLSHNDLQEIAAAVFQNLFSIRYLNLSHNSLTQLKPSSFGSLPTVLQLDLSHNRLREASRGALAKLASCRHIDLSHNQLQTIPQIPISLAELNMSHNNLSEVAAGAWPAMNALLRLDVSHNRLRALRGAAFGALLTLQALHLAANGLDAPPWEALNALSSLQYLYLQGNNITSLSKSAFGNLPTTFHIDLSHNQLASVAPHAFSGLQQLLELSLRGNRLAHIPNEAFKGLVALRKLDLSHNFLQKIDNKTNGLLDDCLSLEMVNLSHNQFGFLSRKMFPASPWVPYRLREVDLSHNELPVLTLDITHGTRTVRTLNLAGNYINDIRPHVLGNLTSLEVLDLSHNMLKDLVSRTSDSTLTLPANITELVVANNSLGALPAAALARARRLRRLDVRGNLLTALDASLVDRVREQGLEVLFEDNKLRCDCLARPLKHYLSRLGASALAAAPLARTVCAEPPALHQLALAALDEERLLCAGSAAAQGEDPALLPEPDLAFRDIQYSQSQIYIHWLVPSAADVADVVVYIRDRNGSVQFSADVSYHLRSLTVTVDDDFKQKLLDEVSFEICIQGKTSNNFARKWFESQCQPVPGHFGSWPKKLVVDKRRLSRKRVSYRVSSSVLGLVSDSILITLCIFIGVCFRRLADLDV